MGLSTFHGGSGYNKTLLSKMSTSVYEPRVGTFASYNKDTGAQTRTMQMIGNGHPRHYFTDGSGRDQYIYRDNGGFTKMYEPLKWESYNYPDKPVYVKAKPAPVMHSKPVFYRADGTGRDAYIE